MSTETATVPAGRGERRRVMGILDVTLIPYGLITAELATAAGELILWRMSHPRRTHRQRPTARRATAVTER